VLDDLEEVAAHHGLAAPDVDVEHLQFAQLVQNGDALLGGELPRVAPAAAAEAVHALQVARVRQFPREADGGVEPALHLLDERLSRH
jgi:hypothetical protein